VYVKSLSATEISTSIGISGCCLTYEATTFMVTTKTSTLSVGTVTSSTTLTEYYTTTVIDTATVSQTVTVTQ